MDTMNEASCLAACLGKLDCAKPEQASAIIASGIEARVHVSGGRGANIKVLKLFGQLCSTETTLLRTNGSVSGGRRSVTGRGLFAFTRRSLLDEYHALRGALSDIAKEVVAAKSQKRDLMLTTSSGWTATGVSSAMLPMIEAAAALATTRVEVAGLYVKLGGAFAGGLPPPAEAVGSVASRADTALALLEPHRRLLPWISEDIASELGLLRRLLRLRTTVGCCEPLESALLARESQRMLVNWRNRAIRRALADLPTIDREMEGIEVELFQICMNSIPDPPSPQLFRDQQFGPRCEKSTREFQHKKGLAANGIVDAVTWKELLASATEHWPRPYWGTMHPETASAASFVLQAALRAAADGNVVAASEDGRGPWAAGSLQLGPFLPPAALWLHDLWLRLCEKMSLYFDQLRKVGRQQLLTGAGVPLETAGRGHSGKTQRNSLRHASAQSEASRLVNAHTPDRGDKHLPSLLPARKTSAVDRSDGRATAEQKVDSTAFSPLGSAETPTRKAGSQDNAKAAGHPATPDRTASGGKSRPVSRNQLVWEAPSRFENRVMELCGGSASRKQLGLDPEAMSKHDDPILDGRHAFAVFFIIDANAAGLQQKREGQSMSIGKDRPQTPFGGFRCRQGGCTNPEATHATGLAQWPVVCSFPRSAAVASAVQQHMPTVAMLLMQREHEDEHYKAQSFCEPDLPAHADQQKSRLGAQGCTYWMVGVEECMTMVVLYPGRHRCACQLRDCHGHPESSAEARAGVERLASRLWLMDEMNQVTAVLVPDAA